MTGRILSFRLPPGVESDEQPIRSIDQLVAHFAAGESPRSHALLGVELELLPILADASCAPYVGESRSVSALLRSLAATGLEAVERDGRIIGLRSSRGAVHLEPGAQVELALPPRASASEVLGDLLHWRALLADHAGALGIALVPLGLQPVTAIPDIQFIPRHRYRIMSQHLGARGELAHHMMKATAGTQLTLDYADEKSAAALFRRVLTLGPIVNALCANSPLEGGRPNGFLSKRPHIWLHTDPDRVGILPWVHAEGFSYERYTRWALGIPVMFALRDDAWVQIGDRTFGDFIKRGHPEAGAARHEDFALHLTTLFPEVRLKQHIEIRGADSVAPELAAGVVALWRGLLHDESAADAAEDIGRHWSTTQRQALHEDAGRLGLAARVGGRSLAELALQLLTHAEAGLSRLSAPDDAALLAPLRRIAESGESPAVDVLRDWATRGPAAIWARA